jgi:hypothetical protein
MENAPRRVVSGVRKYKEKVFNIGEDFYFPLFIKDEMFLRIYKLSLHNYLSKTYSTSTTFILKLRFCPARGLLKSSVTSVSPTSIILTGICCP